MICFKTHGLIISMKQTSGVQDKPTLSPRKGHRKTRDVADASLASRGHRERYVSSEVKAQEQRRCFLGKPNAVNID